MLDFFEFLKEQDAEPPKFDLVVVGGGAGGLTAAINGASERLKVGIIDSEKHLGGHARDSWAIENYPGFPKGITGKKLFDNMANQAGKFGAAMIVDATASRLNRLKDGGYVVTMKDGRQVKATNVILSTGLDYTRVPTLDKFIGNGVYYGMPKDILSSSRLRAGEGNVAIVGGGNSAGQAALHLAELKGLHVSLLVRSNIEKSMSGYLIDRLKQCNNVDIISGVTIKKSNGDNNNNLKSLTLSNGKTLNLNCVFVYAGAQPRTNWLKGAVALDDKGFVKTFHDVNATLPYETSLPGVFAIGDVRAGSTKRISGAVGEGAAALQMVHTYRATQAAVPAAPTIDADVPRKPFPQKYVQPNQCRYPWQKAADGTRCGKRASLYPGKRSHQQGE